MPQTNAYTRGVKYIKIAKLDSGSTDNSIELQNLTDIRIQFSDIPNVTQYNVGAINEYPTYYLYTIVPTDVTSSANQEILNYKVSASSTTGTGANTFNITNYNINANVLNYFTASSGYWTLGNTPNTVLSVTCSVSFSVNPIVTTLTPTPGITLVDITYGNNIYLSPVPALTGVSPKQGNWVSSASFTPIEGSQYIVQVNAGYAQATTTVYSASLLITQSVAPQSSTYDIVVLEPYVGENFYNSDCNVLQNNVDVNVISPFYMDVDFTNSPIIAQNQAAILNGTAARAQVQSWNYAYRSNISGRYVGKQQNAIAVNVYTSASQFVTQSINGFTGSWPGDSTSPSIPVPGNIVIQSLDSCIYEYNWGGGGYPENTNGGGINMGNIYLVGETKDDVTTIKPGDNIYYDLLAKMFSSGSTAYQYQYSSISGLANKLNITYPALGLPGASYSFPSPAQGYYTSIIPYAGTFTPNMSGIPTVTFSSSNTSGIYGTAIDNNGNLISTNIGAILHNTLVNTISSSINNGDRWFVSLYSGSGPTSSPLTGLGYVATGSNLAQYGYPFEISSAYSSSNYAYITLKTGSGVYNVASFFSGSLTTPRVIGFSGSIATTGLLITKADTPTNGLTIFGVPSIDFAGMGAGYILSSYPKKVITENIDYITKTYGNNPN